RTSKARTGLRARFACHRRWRVYGNLASVWVQSVPEACPLRPFLRRTRDGSAVKAAQYVGRQAAEPNVTLYQLNKSCERLAAEIFNRETAGDDDRVDYRAHYNARLHKCFYAETYISPTPGGVNTWVYLSDLEQNRIYDGFHKSTN